MEENDQVAPKLKTRVRVRYEKLLLALRENNQNPDERKLILLKIMVLLTKNSNLVKAFWAATPVRYRDDLPLVYVFQAVTEFRASVEKALAVFPATQSGVAMKVMTANEPSQIFEDPKTLFKLKVNPMAIPGLSQQSEN